MLSRMLVSLAWSFSFAITNLCLPLWSLGSEPPSLADFCLVSWLVPPSELSRMWVSWTQAYAILFLLFWHIFCALQEVSAPYKLTSTLLTRSSLCSLQYVSVLCPLVYFCCPKLSPSLCTPVGKSLSVALFYYPNVSLPLHSSGSECPLLSRLLSFADLTFDVSSMWVSVTHLHVFTC